jgi:hypothetical protein
MSEPAENSEEDNTTSTIPCGLGRQRTSALCKDRMRTCTLSSPPSLAAHPIRTQDKAKGACPRVLMGLVLPVVPRQGGCMALLLTSRLLVLPVVQPMGDAF